ncbi:MAG: MarR family winged helix-turn-helix transcriptional regulator [Erythrobacter sp.]|jgi:DNA-binding MarR family transcriptional regulator|uniref:MarR family winged helix-turn-helix transcriptional regulator n=1 Tax=Erythrobacter sp. TaxID=1042 RepID=UPI002B47BDA4|nr:MarR family winged helix-turn-helix transcriptional regulator [Erythrobacter sp.]WRH70287.1 MAG: MarR family winged helix-turn-helix transcriptional regulator [Erythrobacter sp.]
MSEGGEARPNEGRLAGFLPYQLSVASNAVSDLIAERYRNRFALKVPEWRVMAVLGDAGSMTQRDLTTATLMDKVAVNRAVKVLEDRGLVARVPNPDDGRSHLLELTGEGRAIHAEVMPLALATERDLLSGFAPDEQQVLRDMLEALRKRAGEMARSPR